MTQPNRDADLEELYSDPIVEVERLAKAISLCREARDELGRIADYWQGQALSAADRADMWCNRSDAAETRVYELEAENAELRAAATSFIRATFDAGFVTGPSVTRENFSRFHETKRRLKALAAGTTARGDTGATE